MDNCLTCGASSFRILRSSNVIAGGYVCFCNQGYIEQGNSYCSISSCDMTTGCATCLNNICSYCDPTLNRILNVNTYKCDCKIGYYLTISNTCLQCPFGCKNCLSPSSCILCYTLATMQNGYCNCNPGSYPNPVTQSCENCDVGCVTCTSFTSCTLCKTGFTSSGGLCYCNSGTYLPAGTITCSKCPGTNSAMCDSTGTIISCITNYYLYRSQCYSSCPVGTYQSGTNCIACVSPCISCTGLTNCLSCIPNFYLSGTSCVASCPS